MPPHFRQETVAGIPVWRTEEMRDCIFLLIHGYGGSPDAWTELAHRLEEEGFGVVVPAMRGQTVSGTRKVGFGVGEADELIALAEWVQKEKPEAKMIPVGVSMGGAACWIAASQRPELFDAVVTEGAFARLDWATDEFLSVVTRLGPRLLRPMMWMAEGLSGIRRATVRVDQAAAAWKGKSALIIHGRDDVLFGSRHPEALAEATESEIWWVEGANHAECHLIDFEGYVERLTALARQIQQEPTA